MIRIDIDQEKTICNEDNLIVKEKRVTMYQNILIK